MRWCDNHCHLVSERIGSRSERKRAAIEAVDQARAAGVERLITVGTSVESSRENLALAREFEGVFATAGVHPHDARDGIDGLRELLQLRVAEHGPVAVGECGLDYFYEHSDRAAQREVFEAQIELAAEFDRALVVHSRDAWDDTFAILDGAATPPATVIHCFTGGPLEADKCLERGFVLSFSGIVTFPKAPEVAAAALMCPLDQMMVETDAPFLAPVPFRGKQNVPAWVTHVGEFIATIKGIGAEELANATWATAAAVYRLDEA